ncbi:MAG TPA: hypothetical protein VGE57_13805 [Solimonas sp.]
MNLLVEVTDTNTYDGENTNTRTGETSGFKYQKLWIHIPGEPHPSKNKRVISKEAPILQPGFYEFDLSRSYSDWSWSRITLSTRYLKPCTPERVAQLRAEPLQPKRAA